MEDYIPLELTYIVYKKNDLTGLLLGFSSLIPLTCFASLVTLFLYTKDTTIQYALLGFVCLEIINSILKYILKQQRPEKSPISGFGMPSDHSGLSFYIATSLVLTCKFSFSLNIVFVLVASTVAYSRFYLHYHSLYQVLCGGCIGVLFGMIWWEIKNPLILNF